MINEIQTIQFNQNDLKQNIPSQLVDIIQNRKNIKIIPNYYYELLKINIERSQKFNNKKSFDKLINLIIFIISNENHSYKKIRNITGRNYKSYINFLKHSGIILNFDNHIEGVKAKKYNLVDTDDTLTLFLNYESDEIIEDEIIDKNYKLEGDKLFTLENTQINIPLAIKLNNEKAIEKHENKKGCYSAMMTNRIIAISRFINKRYYFKSENCGRLFSSFTELSKESRKALFININGIDNYFHSVDLKNASPYLLSLIIKNEFNIESDFLKDTSKGVFYEKLQNQCLKSNPKAVYSYDKKRFLDFKQRDDIKIMVCGSILYGNLNNKVLLEAFKTLYKNEYKALQDLKQKHGKELANKIMKIESEIFLNIEIDDFTFTVHDEINFIYCSQAVEIELVYHLQKNFGYSECSISIDENEFNNSFEILESIFKQESYKIKEEKKLNKSEKLVSELIKEKRKVKEIIEITGLSKSQVYKIKKKLK